MNTKIDLKPGQTILFTGDSITDADRMNSAYRPFGFGYVNFAANALLARYPEYDLNIINTGIGGNTVRDLTARWQRDCIDHQPDVLSVLIGINDLWYNHEVTRMPEAVCLEEYELTYRQLLLQAREKCGCKFILMEPFMFCNEAENSMLKGLRGYISIVHKLSDEFDAVLVRLQDGIDEKIPKVSPEKWSDDMVHPFVWAHAWIAQCWLNIIGR